MTDIPDNTTIGNLYPGDLTDIANEIVSKPGLRWQSHHWYGQNTPPRAKTWTIDKFRKTLALTVRLVSFLQSDGLHTRLIQDPRFYTFWNWRVGASSRAIKKLLDTAEAQGVRLNVPWLNWDLVEYTPTAQIDAFQARLKLWSAYTQAGGTRIIQWFEHLDNLRGFDPSNLKPYVSLMIRMDESNVDPRFFLILMAAQYKPEAHTEIIPALSSVRFESIPSRPRTMLIPLVEQALRRGESVQSLLHKYAVVDQLVARDNQSLFKLDNWINNHVHVEHVLDWQRLGWPKGSALDAQEKGLTPWRAPRWPATAKQLNAWVHEQELLKAVGPEGRILDLDDPEEGTYTPQESTREVEVETEYASTVKLWTLDDVRSVDFVLRRHKPLPHLERARFVDLIDRTLDDRVITAQDVPKLSKVSWDFFGSSVSAELKGAPLQLWLAMAPEDKSERAEILELEDAPEGATLPTPKAERFGILEYDDTPTITPQSLSAEVAQVAQVMFPGSVANVQKIDAGGAWEINLHTKVRVILIYAGSQAVALASGPGFADLMTAPSANALDALLEIARLLPVTAFGKPTERFGMIENPRRSRVQERAAC